MNYTELQQAIIEDTHRPDKAALIPRFIRLGEGLIRRDLKAYELSIEFDNNSRVNPNEAVYSIPVDVTEIRVLHRKGAPENNGLLRVAPDAIRKLRMADKVAQYCQYGSGAIEFRGNPSVDDVFQMVYFGMPAPLSQVPTNELLTDHEGLYQSAATYYLYLHTQDRELAQDQATTFDAIMERINEYMARKIGGASNTPSYNFSVRSAR